MTEPELGAGDKAAVIVAKVLAGSLTHKWENWLGDGHAVVKALSDAGLLVGAGDSNGAAKFRKCPDCAGTGRRYNHQRWKKCARCDGLRFVAAAEAT